MFCNNKREFRIYVNIVAVTRLIYLYYFFQYSSTRFGFNLALLFDERFYITRVYANHSILLLPTAATKKNDFQQRGDRACGQLLLL